MAQEHTESREDLGGAPEAPGGSAEAVIKRREEARLNALDQRADMQGMLALSLQQAKEVCLDAGVRDAGTVAFSCRGIFSGVLPVLWNCVLVPVSLSDSRSL